MSRNKKTQNQSFLNNQEMQILSYKSKKNRVIAYYLA